MDAVRAKYAFLDQGKCVWHAAPAVVLLQFSNQEKSMTPELARQHAAVVSEPKQVKFYDAPHALNAEARLGRIQVLTEQLVLNRLSPALIVSIPNLYQPPDD